MTRALALAIQHARRIRRNLVRRRRDTDLGGDCGLASVLLADALGSPISLRATNDAARRLCTPHVWNVVGGHVIDITATQFNDLLESFDAGEPPVFGVLVTREPRLYHQRPVFSGRGVLDYFEEANWYDGRQDLAQLSAPLARLRAWEPRRDRRARDLEMAAGP